MADTITALKEKLSSLGAVTVFLTDDPASEYLLTTAKEVLGEKVDAASVEGADLSATRTFCEENGISQYTFAAGENAVDTYTLLKELKDWHKTGTVCIAATADSEKDPVWTELGFETPLTDAGITAEDITE